jgi:hypothetical protein
LRLGFLETNRAAVVPEQADAHEADTVPTSDPKARSKFRAHRRLDLMFSQSGSRTAAADRSADEELGSE